MKMNLRLFLAVLSFCWFGCSEAFASVQFFNSSDVNLGNQYKVKCATGLTCAMSSGKLVMTPTSLVATGDVTGDGGDQLYGFLDNQVAASTTALTAAQCGSTIISAGAAVQPLPEASTVLGCTYKIVCGTADDLDINPDDADVIGPVNSVAAGTGAAITPSAGDAIRCTDIGSSIVIQAVSASRWAAIGVANGAWTDVN